jgi:hypothetical protein
MRPTAASCFDLPHINLAEDTAFALDAYAAARAVERRFREAGGVACE